MKPRFSTIGLALCFAWFSVGGFAQQPAALKNMPLDSLMAWLKRNKESKDTVFYQYAHLGLRRAIAQNNNTYIGACHFALAGWHYRATHRQQDSILHYEKQYLHYTALLNDRQRLAEAYIYHSVTLKDLGQYKEGEAQLFKAIALYEQLNAPAGIAHCYRRLCDFARHVADYEAAIRYGELAVQMHRQSKSSIEEQMDPLLCLMTAYNEAGAPLKAIEQANRLLDARDKGLIKDGIDNRMYIYYQRALAYTALQQYELAIADHEAILQLDSSLNKNPTEIGPTYEDLANVAYLKKDYAAAIPNLLKYIEYEQAQGYEEPIVGARLKLADCYAQTGAHAQAYWQAAQATTLQKKLYENKLSAIRAELRDKYDADQKEQTIQLQQFRLQQQQMIQGLSLSVAGLLFLLLLGLFFTYRHNRRRSLQLHALNTELAETNAQLDRRNAQNELLLKEIHHRVKNNLEMVSSLLMLQSRQINDPDVRRVMEEGQNRVQSIGLVHQKLYQGENLAGIEMKDYFILLSESILDTFDTEDRIQIECIMDKLEMDVDTAVPIGLIVNELLTNAMKYAFPDGRHGRVRIQLEVLHDEYLRLEVADNGIGKTAQIKGTGFGSQLITLLTRQLGGTLQEEVKDGTRVCLEFKKNKTVRWNAA